ncbi:putative D-amino-acid dehydrogenase [Synechococcus sp. A15-62]|uniref:NAD(P)/FAD-dependent oxidoreductase n=1 Tax=Synechococcus sp. A15-62 TaxID=1050657 RepID=UPI001645FD53|nr:FAD-dependent oxidoreductase [Synechococcus sp. A15-62]QNJ01624.1 putative D-amino-acid dehydrogenase [Synechococcus sp. A15-62]
MIGAGAIGLGTAWHLAQQGHDVSLYDPRLNQSVDREGSAKDLSGTSASLGVLMGYVFRRRSGRGWRLRRRSMELWPQWIEMLQAHQPDLKLHPGLLQIARDEQAAERMESLAAQRVDLGLQMVNNADLATVWPTASHGGLHSRHDGRIDPLLLQQALRKALAEQNAELNATAVVHLERNDNHWRVHHTDGNSSIHDCVVLCTALNSDVLLEPLGQVRPMTPVLGQALSLRLTTGPTTWSNWPSVLVNQGFNLIPTAPGRLLLGATVEPGDRASEDPLTLMRNLNERAPEWLCSATVVGNWSGLRARPMDRPAPLLEELEPGLILASGHYRNGVLLTPGTAEWVTTAVEQA